MSFIVKAPLRKPITKIHFFANNQRNHKKLRHPFASVTQLTALYVFTSIIMYYDVNVLC